MNFKRKYSECDMTDDLIWFCVGIGGVFYACSNEIGVICLYEFVSVIMLFFYGVGVFRLNVYC